MQPSRRTLLAAAGAAGAAASATASAARAGHGGGGRGGPPEMGAAWLQSVLERYAGFGIKASGGAGDTATGAWLEEELRRAGFRCERHAFEVPFFEAREASLTCGEARAEVHPQPIVVATGPQGIAAPLRLAERHADLSGAVALVALPTKRWVTLLDPQVSRPIAEAIGKGAAAVVLVTNGPTGEQIGLNVSLKRPPFERPVATLAPRDAAPFLAAAAEGRAARLVVDGKGGGGARRPAFNLVGRLDRNAPKTLIVSTPRSGWFTCAAERGSGLAVWLALAHWLARGDHGVNLEFLATSGHEYEYVGGERYLAERAPKPAQTRMWVHIGASLAARDWHELGPRLFPLPSADSQRVLTATGDVLPRVRTAFKGITGLEATYETTKAMAGGELVNVIEAGYATAIGEYGGHRYFHTPGDDMRCTSGDLAAPVAAAYRRVLSAML
jgi:hypothetical protein